MKNEYERWFLDLLCSWKGAIAMIMLLVLTILISLFTPTRVHGAVWVKLGWTSRFADTLRVVQVRAPGDTIDRAVYAAAGGAIKTTTSAGSDSAWISLSTANVTSGSVRLLAFAGRRRSASPPAWSSPSNALSLFYAARDTVYATPTGGWIRGPGTFYLSQPEGSTSWPYWEHQELVQRRAQPRLCQLFRDSLSSYWCLRGIRQRNCP